jgi:hypothetical protein
MGPIGRQDAWAAVAGSSGRSKRDRGRNCVGVAVVLEGVVLGLDGKDAGRVIGQARGFDDAAAILGAYQKATGARDFAIDHGFDSGVPDAVRFDPGAVTKSATAHEARLASKERRHAEARPRSCRRPGTRRPGWRQTPSRKVRPGA